jgi:ribose transport system substrate-binding protein
MNNEGKYVNVRHMPGGNCFLTRTWGYITELREIAPEMECIDMATTELDAELTQQVVSDWLTKYGDELEGICACEDNAPFLGCIAAMQQAGREDVILVGNGNSKVGMDAVKAGEADAVSWQEPMIQGALGVLAAVNWMNGLGPQYMFLAKDVVTTENVDEFMPASW